MLCPRCGRDVGASITICDSCKMQASASAVQAEAVQPQPGRRVSNTQEIELLYKQALGVGKAEAFMRILTSPLVIAILSTAGFLVILGFIFVFVPTVKWYAAVLLALAMLALAIYWCTYLTVLLDLFYVDRTACLICLLGLAGIPFVAWLYRDELGTRKPAIVTCGYFIALLLIFAAAAVSDRSTALAIEQQLSTSPRRTVTTRGF